MHTSNERYACSVVGPFKMWRRSKLRALPFSEAWKEILLANVPYYSDLEVPEREALHELIQIFLAEKHFEGCGGLTLNDEIKLTIAAEACRLLLHRHGDIYPGLESILVYPHAYKAKAVERDGPIFTERSDARLGESWTRGAVVLAWDHINRRSGTHIAGENVVLHEFAHQLDAEDGAMDGTPQLSSLSRFVPWAKVMTEAYTELVERIHQGHHTDIDSYGTKNAAEFFAVVTEMYFERGEQLKAGHPKLYEKLAEFYRPAN